MRGNKGLTPGVIRSYSRAVSLGWSSTDPGPRHKTNVISGPALKRAWDGVGWRNLSEPMKQSMLEAFNEADQSHARRGQRKERTDGACTVKNRSGEEVNPPFPAASPFCSAFAHSQHTQFQPCSVIADEPVYLLGPVSFSVKWEVGRLHWLSGAC